MPYIGVLTPKLGTVTLKILIQIPCLNEERDIADVIRQIPRVIPGCKQVDILLIDDASTDQTIECARNAGIDIIISKKSRGGLANSFKLGQAFFLSQDYDVLINTDGDNQYFQEQIPVLLQPIFDNKADLVIGDRKIADQIHFSFSKKLLQRLGSKVVSWVAGTEISDAASGFRAYSRSAMVKLFITTNFSYALESIIQAGNKGLRIRSVEIGVRNVSRPSRLFKSDFEHVKKSGTAILKSFLMYTPMKIFSILSFFTLLLGLIPMIRYLVLNFSGVAGQHIQSLILGSLLITTSAILLVLGLVAELSKIHRKMFEEEKALSRLNEKLALDVVLSAFSATIFFSDAFQQEARSSGERN
jgi:glycosyltransferase involved in cell wall biosynthesis